MKTATQLKANIRNLAKKTGVAPQTLYMNYAVERLLKRLSLSKYKQHFILKGGILIAYTIGFEARGTMDGSAMMSVCPAYRTDALLPGQKKNRYLAYPESAAIAFWDK